jgi:hypothetical protein
MQHRMLYARHTTRKSILSHHLVGRSCTFISGIIMEAFWVPPHTCMRDNFTYFIYPHVKGKVKVMLPLCLIKNPSRKTYCGSGGIAPYILKLSTVWRWVVNFMSWPLYPWGKSSCYPLNIRLSATQSQSGWGGKEKNSHNCPCWELNHSHPACSIVSILTQLLHTLL